MTTRWKGTIAVEGKPADDGRSIGSGALNFEFLPLPLLRPPRIEEVAGVEVNRPAEQCGEVEAISRERDGSLKGTGWIEDQVIIDLLTHPDFSKRSALGVGIVLDDVTGTVDEADHLHVTEARIKAVQITPTPAFSAAWIRTVA